MTVRIYRRINVRSVGHLEKDEFLLSDFLPFALRFSSSLSLSLSFFFYFPLDEEFRLSDGGNVTTSVRR